MRPLWDLSVPRARTRAGPYTTQKLNLLTGGTDKLFRGSVAGRCGRRYWAIKSWLPACYWVRWHGDETFFLASTDGSPSSSVFPYTTTETSARLLPFSPRFRLFFPPFSLPPSRSFFPPFFPARFFHSRPGTCFLFVYCPCPDDRFAIGSESRVNVRSDRDKIADLIETRKVSLNENASFASGFIEIKAIKPDRGGNFHPFESLLNIFLFTAKVYFRFNFTRDRATL